MNQEQGKQKPVLEPPQAASDMGANGRTGCNKTFDERTVAPQYPPMRTRLYRSRAWLTLPIWAALTLSVLGQTATKDQQLAERRWGKDIRAFETADKTNPPPKHAILFIGSSSIRRWTHLAQAFPEHRVINRGFGGSELSDSVAFADRIVIPYQPKLILLYEGDNDIAAGKSPERILADFKEFVRRVHAALPRTPIVYIAIKPCPARARFLEPVKATNRLIRDYATTSDLLLYADVFTPMLSKEGKSRADLYVKDGLHPNDRGYAIWIPILKPILDKYDPPRNGGNQP